MENICRKCATKMTPRPLSNFGKWPKTGSAYKIFLILRYFENRIITKPLKS